MTTRRQRPPEWKLPAGVAAGTWDYTHSDSIADDYDAFLSGTRLTKTDLRIVGSMLPDATREDALVADLGCGTGRTLEMLNGKGYGVLGVDLSQRMLIQFHRRIKTLDQPGRLGEASQAAHAIRANLVELDAVADHAVDHSVCLFSTLGMIRSRVNRRRAIAHFCRITRPGGMVILHAHNRWAAIRDPGGVMHLIDSWQKSRTDPEADFGDRIYGYRGLPNMFLHSFGLRELVTDMRLAGLRIERRELLTVGGEGVLEVGWLLGGWRSGGFVVVGRK